MGRMWKNLRTNSMYWRFRYVTRNRIRLRNWWAHHRPARGGARPYQMSGARGRGAAAYTPYSTGRSRRTWAILLIMVALMTVVHMAGEKGDIAGGLGGILDTLIIVGAIYYALRRV